MSDPHAVRIAVIDSGVDRHHPSVLGRGQIVVGPTVDRRGLEQDPDATDHLGHGTAIAGAILDLAPGSELLSIRVFLDRLECPFDYVVRALVHAISWGPDLINVSLGTTDATHRPRLESLAAAAAKVDCRIVAPATMSGLPSYPGVLAEVEGVIVDANVPRQLPVQRPHGDRTWWFASPEPAREPGQHRPMNPSGASLASAHVTGHLARLLRL